MYEIYIPNINILNLVNLNNLQMYLVTFFQVFTIWIN